MRRIYEYLLMRKRSSLKIKRDLKKLEQEINQNKNSFSSFVREILYSTRDIWNLEIEEEIKDN
ncbi:hypothetical protein Q5O89_02685 [Peribacillus frigoritolerans]|nr:hypothetical protein [Peribacillus frigoritolerans]